MALVNRDRVLETTTTTGTGTLTLAGAVAGFQSFAAIGNGNTCHYSIWEVDSNGNPSGAWEVGLGTYTSAGTTLARTTVIASSNSNNAVSFAAGTKRVGVVHPASGTVIVREAGGTPGSDEIQISSTSPFAKLAYKKSVGGSGWIIQSGAGGQVDVRFQDAAGVTYVRYQDAGITVKDGSFAISSGDPASVAPDILVNRVSAGILALTDAGSTNDTTLAIRARSSTTNNRDRIRVATVAVDNTDASRKYRGIFSAYDTAARECFRIEASGSAPMLGFFGAAAVVRGAAWTPTNVTTDRSFDANATTVDELADALGTLIQELQGLGLLS